MSFSGQVTYLLQPVLLLYELGPQFLCLMSVTMVKNLQSFEIDSSADVDNF